MTLRTWCVCPLQFAGAGGPRAWLANRRCEVLRRVYPPTGIRELAGNRIDEGSLRGHYTDLGPFRLIRREALDRLYMQDTNFGWTIEMQINARRIGLRVLKIPLNSRKRIAGESKISDNFAGTIRAGWKILWIIAKHALLTGRSS